MPPNAITFRLVPEIRHTQYRAVGFLEGDEELNASGSFDALKQSRREFILNSMGEWIDGKHDITTRFHGWPNDSECWMCFTFKAREGKVGHRFYGYLCNPKKNNPSFQLCALCVYARKTERETDRAELLRVKSWSQSPVALRAIQKIYADGEIHTFRGQDRL